MTLCLVIDDDKSARDATVSLSRELGFNTAEADDGKQAAGFCMGKMPDVILLDIMMPNLDGIDFVKKVRTLSQGSKPYIIANSALHQGDEQVAAVLAAGANTFLSKPFGIDALQKKLEEANILPSSSKE